MRRAAAAVAALALVAGGAACDRKRKALPTHTPAEVVAALRDSGTVRAAMTIRLELPLGEVMNVTATGDLDLARRRSRMGVEYDALGTSTGFVAHDEVADGDLTYVARPGAAKWFRFPGPYSGARPYDVVAALEGAPALERVRDETIRGIRTVHYVARPPGFFETVDVWVTREGLPVRLVARVRANPVTKTIDLDYGRAQAIAVPTRYVAVKDASVALDAVKKP